MQYGAQGSDPRPGHCQAPAALPKGLLIFRESRDHQVFGSAIGANKLFTHNSAQDFCGLGCGQVPPPQVAFEEAMIADDDICFSRKPAGVAIEQAH